MHTKTKLISLTFSTLALLSVGAVAAPPSEYLGSRGDVRAFISAGDDRFLLEGYTYSLCLTPWTDVLCRDDGTCASTNFDLARAAGYQKDKDA